MRSTLDMNFCTSRVRTKNHSWRTHAPVIATAIRCRVRGGPVPVFPELLARPHGMRCAPVIKQSKSLPRKRALNFNEPKTEINRFGGFVLPKLLRAPEGGRGLKRRRFTRAFGSSTTPQRRIPIVWSRRRTQKLVTRLWHDTRSRSNYAANSTLTPCMPEGRRGRNTEGGWCSSFRHIFLPLRKIILSYIRIVCL